MEVVFMLVEMDKVWVDMYVWIDNKFIVWRNK